MRRIGQLAFASASLLAFATPVYAQNAASSADEGASSDTSEIIVQARRRSESAQDVPLTVNAVTSAELEKLNIRDFKDIAAIVPGLSLTPAADGLAPSASLRGVNFDVNGSGNSGTIQFYMNDAPISAGFLFNSMFDIGQVEVLRGPQGTLRGIASPSGSITLTTRKPDMEQWGGYVQGTVNTIGGVNVNGAINVPIIKGVLALRAAGIVNDDDGTRVRSLNSSTSPNTHYWGERVTLQFNPTDNISITGTYQHFLTKGQYFDQVESANLALNLPVVGTLITPGDRLAVENTARSSRINYNIYNVQAEWRFAGQKLNYVGSWSDQDALLQPQGDVGNVFDDSYPTVLQNYGQTTHSQSKQQSHEIRLSSDERLFGMVDYVIGGMINRLESPTDLTVQTPIFLGAPTPANFYAFNIHPGEVRGRTLERSVFGNVTVHLGDATEISGGIRYIHFNNESNLPGASGDYHATVYTASIKHRFNDNIMAYASTGSSWRVGAGTNAIILGTSGNTAYSDAALAAPTCHRSTAPPGGSVPVARPPHRLRSSTRNATPTGRRLTRRKGACRDTTRTAPAATSDSDATAWKRPCGASPGTGGAAAAATSSTASPGVRRMYPDREYGGASGRQGRTASSSAVHCSSGRDRSSRGATTPADRNEPGASPTNTSTGTGKEFHTCVGAWMQSTTRLACRVTRTHTVTGDTTLSPAELCSSGWHGTTRGRQ